MIDINKCRETDGTKNIHLKGKREAKMVYSIPIDMLFYNDQNDRIASEISEYLDNNNIQNFDRSDINQFNDIFARFIIKSNEPSYKKTRDNIKAIGQLEPGVVLSDGRIIDGNRRFTCLRELYKDTGNQEFAYFNAVIIKEEEVTSKDIKLMELEIQIGTEEKVGYDTIDRCAGIYRDLIKEGHVLTDAEYCASTNMTERELSDWKNKAEIVAEFLSFFNKDEKFYIAKELQIDGPISELKAFKKNCEDEEWTKIKTITFPAILNKTQNDITRYIRDIKTYVIPAEEKEEAFENMQKVQEHILTEIVDENIISVQDIEEKIRGNEEIKNDISAALDSIIESGKVAIIFNKPKKLLEKIKNDIKQLDTDVIRNQDQDSRDDVERLIGECIELLENVKDKIDA